MCIRDRSRRIPRRSVRKQNAAPARPAGISSSHPEKASTAAVSSVLAHTPHHRGVRRGSSTSAAARPARVTAARQVAVALIRTSRSAPPNPAAAPTRTAAPPSTASDRRGTSPGAPPSASSRGAAPSRPSAAPSRDAPARYELTAPKVRKSAAAAATGRAAPPTLRASSSVSGVSVAAAAGPSAPIVTTASPR